MSSTVTSIIPVEQNSCIDMHQGSLEQEGKGRSRFILLVPTFPLTAASFLCDELRRDPSFLQILPRREQKKTSFI